MSQKMPDLLVTASIAVVCLAGCSAKTSHDQVVGVTIEQIGEESGVTADAVSGTNTAEQPRANPIVIVKGREHTITIYSSADGPRFTVATNDGKVLADRLNADGIRQQLPEIYKAYESSFAGGGSHLDASRNHLDASGHLAH